MFEPLALWITLLRMSGLLVCDLVAIIQLFREGFCLAFFAIVLPVFIYAVWLYFVFSLSFRDVKLLLHQRGIVVSHEAIRNWAYKFDPQFAKQVRQKRRSVTDKWHLDEVFVTINGHRYYLWRAVDSEGMVIF